MTPIDYQELGVKCGVEIHQQLEGKKLFCRTPTIIRDDEPDYAITRKLRAVSGETGQIDVAAAAEMKKQKVFVYEGYSDTIGLVELDEEPPAPMNHQALYTAVQLAHMLKARVVDEVQVMRKTVVDGSNTSGFQRTALVATNGVLDIGKPVGIQTVVIEEDACKKVDRQKAKDAKDGIVRYNLSRLGIPLIEIATDPDMKTAQEVQDVCAALGSLLRDTGRVKRGIGTIRQDINVSIAKGNRVEIKGAQDLANIASIVDYEVIRQVNIVALQKEQLRVDEYKQLDLTYIFENTKCSFVAKAIKQQKVLAIKLLGFATKLGREIQPKKRMGTELSDYAKVHTGIGGIIHSDEDLAKYQFSDDEIHQVRQKLQMTDSDAFILIVGDEDTATKAFDHIIERINQLWSGTVAKEVRKANADCTSSYLRPMPGGARMYPETDCMPARADFDVELPESLDKKIKKYTDLGLATDLATKVAKGPFLLFDKYVDELELKPTFLAEVLVGLPVQLRRKENISLQADDDRVLAILQAQSNGSLVSEMSIIIDIIKETQDGVSIEKSIEKRKMLGDDELQQIVDEIKKEYSGKPMGLVMGKIMAKTKGRADGKRVKELLG